MISVTTMCSQDVVDVMLMEYSLFFYDKCTVPDIHEEGCKHVGGVGVRLQSCGVWKAVCLMLFIIKTTC